MFMLIRPGLYTAIDHVPSKARDLFGLYKQPEQFTPFQAPLGW